ncbi:endo-1,4-beta-xylanase [Cellulomonas sp. URHD0024]|uniref:endo-1,4-beta-xylanase n=1 Tax=Cellulomonas sp. URHD0024 TaxID=1302620 RepID=UPI0004036C14|nr:endo-1,4-beta-xylanase [Cellulomonas sp. URHD0024]
MTTAEGSPRGVARVDVDGRLEHRVVRATLTLRGPDGAPLAGQPVTVRQTRHAFAFGNIGFDFVPLANDETDDAPRAAFGGASPATARTIAELWFDVFNTVTLPFYWAGFEPERGRPDTRRLHRTAQWFVDRGVAVKGHPLVWHTLAPPWLLDLDEGDVEEVVRARITREVGDFGDVIRTWDAINEVVIMPVFEKEENAITELARRLGRVQTVRLAFETARAADPGLTLLLNDFNMSAAYERLVEECLDAGIRIDALGLQSHMHQGYWGEERTLEVLDRFSRFGLPLHLTETTLVSGELMPPEIVDLNDYQVPSWPTTPEGEERQADELERHYRTLLGHPAVQAATYWGLTDDGSWLGAPSGLLRADGTPKPGYEAVRRLVREEWWLSPREVVTDGHGRMVVEGFAGEYEVDVDGTTVPVQLDLTDGRTQEVALLVG